MYDNFLLKSLGVWILEIWFVIHEKTQILLILQDVHFKKNDFDNLFLIFRHRHIFANQTSDSLTPSLEVDYYESDCRNCRNFSGLSDRARKHPSSTGKPREVAIDTLMFCQIQIGYINSGTFFQIQTLKSVTVYFWLYENKSKLLRMICNEKPMHMSCILLQVTLKRYKNYKRLYLMQN